MAKQDDEKQTIGQRRSVLDMIEPTDESGKARRNRINVPRNASNGPGNDLANLLVAAQRRNADKHKSKRQVPHSHSEDGPRSNSTTSPPQTATLARPTDATGTAPFQQDRTSSGKSDWKHRDERGTARNSNANGISIVPSEATDRPLATTSSQRTTTQTPARSPQPERRRDTRAPSRVYTADRRKYDAEFDRSLHAAAKPEEAAPKEDKAVVKKLFEYRSGRQERPGADRERDRDVKKEKSLVANRDVPSAQSEEERNKTLFDPQQHDPVKFTKPLAVAPSSSNGNTNGKDSNSAHSDSGSRGGRRRARNSAESGSETSDAKTAQPGANPVVERLKRAYKKIVDLESKRLAEADHEKHRGDNTGFQREPKIKVLGQKDKDDAYWMLQIEKHKELAEAHNTFLQMALDPRLPPSLHSMPQKYNTPSRLWQNGFYLLLERLRHAMPLSPQDDSEGLVSADNMLDHLVEFIHYAYTFYTILLEEQSMNAFRPIWLEQLGDLARYRMAVAGLATRLAAARVSEPGHELRQGSVARLATTDKAAHARIDQDGSVEDVASIGEAALNDWDVDDCDIWKKTASEWYGKGLQETPGTGRLHHHLALLSRGDDVKALYHYVKSLTASHPHPTSRESILSLFDKEEQQRRTLPDTTPAQLFVHLHGMLFTKINLDEFEDVLARFLEKAEEEYFLLYKGQFRSDTGVSVPELATSARWMMMAVINIAALLQYGNEDGVLHKALSKDAAIETGKPTAVMPQAIMLNPATIQTRPHSDSGASDPASETNEDDGGLADQVKKLNVGAVQGYVTVPNTFVLARKLAFGLLALALKRPFKPRHAEPPINPYLSTMLTFLAHIVQNKEALALVECDIPWTPLVGLLENIPKSVELRTDPPAKLIGVPLPEDWCIRGMEWAGRSLFGRGYWKYRLPTGKGSVDAVLLPGMQALPDSEMTILDQELEERNQLERDMDIVVESQEAADYNLTLSHNRWKRVASSAAIIARHVPGLILDLSARPGQKFKILPSLNNKMKMWQAEANASVNGVQKQLEKSKSHVSASGPLDSDSDDGWEEDEALNDSPEAKTLKARRRQFKAMIKEARQKTTARGYAAAVTAKSPAPTTSKPVRSRRTLHILAGYTILVFDTNMLLNGLPIFSGLLESKRWTLVVPLVVLTELDGLKGHSGNIGQLAAKAIHYLETHIKPFSLYLKVQTSRGNYLVDVTIRREDVDFRSLNATSMDDIVLQAAVWQRDHFVNRLWLLRPDQSQIKPVPDQVSKVALVSLDRNLRLKARASSVEALNEAEIVKVLVPMPGHEDFG